MTTSLIPTPAALLLTGLTALVYVAQSLTQPLKATPLTNGRTYAAVTTSTTGGT